jgi:hypothetical protein
MGVGGSVVVAGRTLNHDQPSSDISCSVLMDQREDASYGSWTPADPSSPFNPATAPHLQ